MGEPNEFGDNLAVTFTDEQWQETQGLLWEQAFAVSGSRDETQAALDGLSATIETERKRRGFVDHDKVMEQERRYWELHGQLLAIRDHETDIMRLLERIEAGEASLEEAMAFLPDESDEDEDKGPRLSKKKLAIQRERAQMGTFGDMDTSGILSFTIDLDNGWFTRSYALTSLYGTIRTGYATSDPRRIASGRSLKRVGPDKVNSALTAADTFHYYTADTHGGKSRRPGKGANSYIGSNGKRLRKR